MQDLLALRTKLAEAQVQHAMGYSRHLYEIATEAQAGYSALAEEVFAAYTKGMASWVDKASKSAPAGSESAINAFKSTIAATTAAFDQFQKAGKQVVSMADANVRRAAATASKSRQGPQGCVSKLQCNAPVRQTTGATFRSQCARELEKSRAVPISKALSPSVSVSSS